MIRSTLSALALAGTLLALPAVAQNTRSGRLEQTRIEFAASDINHDGVLTKPEVAESMRHLKMAGASRPLTREQIDQLTDLFFRNADANHDGRVTLAESEAFTTQLFDRYDTNHDGVISPAESAAAKRALAARTTRR